MAGFRLVVDPNADITVAAALEDYLANRLGPRIQENAKRTVPVRTGDLKDSIIIQVDLNGLESVLQVGVDETVRGVDYGLFVERGTSRAPAQPYLRPAVYQARGQL